MQSIVIAIILLSIIGLYINLSSVTEMNKPELNRLEPDTVIVSENNQDKPIHENEIFEKSDLNSMWTNDSLAKTNGLKPGKTLVNIDAKTDISGPRPTKWMNSTKREIDEHGLIKSNLSYKNNFPYNEDSLKNIDSIDNIKQDFRLKDSKAESSRSQIILPKDESKFKEGYGYVSRAIAILRNQVSNENKNLPYLYQINSEEVINRGSKTIRERPHSIDIKEKPDLLSSHAEKDFSNVNVKKNNFNHSENSLNQKKAILNLNKKNINN